MTPNASRKLCRPPTFRKARSLIADCNTDCGKTRHVQCDNPAEVPQTAFQPSGSDGTMTTETTDATPAPTVSTETPETRVQPALATQIFDEGTTPTTSLSQDVRTQSRITTQCSWTHQASGLVSSTRNTHRTCRCRGACRESSPWRPRFLWTRWCRK